MRRRAERLAVLFAALVACAAPGAHAGVTPLFELPLPRTSLPMAARRDATGQPYLYVACKDEGLRIYALGRSPKLVATVRVEALGGRHPMSFTQDGARLYVALGDHWARSPGAGLAVVDVRDPRHAAVLGTWSAPGAAGAGGAVAVSGSVAYLAAMADGVYALDVGDPTAIHAVGHLVPDPAFPDPRPDRKKVNARGLALRDRRLYLCYDAGGVRVLDVADPRAPREIGRYSNPAMNGKPRAYNNVVLDGPHAYVTVDYVGVEVLDVSDPASVQSVAWWNPWNPRLIGLKWFGCAGHANEIALDAGRRQVFVAAGKTDLVILDVSDPAHPRPAGGFGDVDDTRATWGVSLYGDEVYLSYICTLGIPFRADWVGVQALRVTP